jgi:hypothetical protein
MYVDMCVYSIWPISRISIKPSLLTSMKTSRSPDLLCLFLSHTHSLTHTHTLSFDCHSANSSFHALSSSNNLFYTHTYTHSNSLSPSLWHTHTCNATLPLYLYLTHTYPLSWLPLSKIQLHTYIHTALHIFWIFDVIKKQINLKRYTSTFLYVVSQELLCICMYVWMYV